MAWSTRCFERYGGDVSRENLESVRRVLEAVTERDLAALMSLTDPEVEWRSFFAALLRGGEYRGHEALQRYVDDLNDAFEVIRPEAIQLLEVGDLVVGVGRVCYRGRASGVEAEDASVGWVFRFKDGKGGELPCVPRAGEGVRDRWSRGGSATRLSEPVGLVGFRHGGPG